MLSIDSAQMRSGAVFVVLLAVVILSFCTLFLTQKPATSLDVFNAQKPLDGGKDRKSNRQEPPLSDLKTTVSSLDTREDGESQQSEQHGVDLRKAPQRDGGKDRKRERPQRDGGKDRKSERTQPEPQLRKAPERKPTAGNESCGQSGSPADELNCLTRKAIQRYAKPRRRKIAFLKTHKTGSTTLATVLFRLGVRHCMHVYDGPGHYWEGQADRTGVEIYNRHSRINFYEWVQNLERLFEQQPTSNPFFLVSIFREPVEHYVSWYNYFKYPVEQVPISEYVQRDNAMKNLLLRKDLQIKPNKSSAEEWLAKGLPRINLVLLTSRFDEGLVLLAEVLGLDLIDVSYLRLNSNGEGALNWAELSTGSFSRDELSGPTLKRIKGLTKVDAMVYEQIVKRYMRQLAYHKKRMGEAEFQRRVDELAHVQARLTEQCTAHPGSAACDWYQQNDNNTETDAQNGLPLSSKRESQYHLGGREEPLLPHGPDQYPTGCEERAKKEQSRSRK